MGLDQEIHGGVVTDINVDGMAVNVLDEEVDLSLVEEVKGDLIVLRRILIGVHVLIVGLDQAFHLS